MPSRKTKSTPMESNPVTPPTEPAPIAESKPIEPPIQAELTPEAATQAEGRFVAPATEIPPMPPTQVVAPTNPVPIKPGEEWMHDPNLNAGMPPVEAKSITLMRTQTYQMPGTCPVCNGPRLGGTGKIHTSSSYRSGNYQYSIALDFPLCQKCTDTQAFFTKLNNRASLYALPIGILALVIIFILGINSGTSEAGGYICGGLIGGAIAWGIGLAIINPILSRNLPAPLKERNKRIAGAASITNFSPTHVTFKFNNAAYGDAFHLLNTLGMQGLLDQLTKLLPKK